MSSAQYKMHRTTSSNTSEGSTIDSTTPAPQKGVAHKVLKKTTPGCVGNINDAAATDTPTTRFQSKSRKRKMVEHADVDADLEAAEALIEQRRAAKKARHSSGDSATTDDSSNKSEAVAVFASASKKRKADASTESKEARHAPAKRPRLLTGVGEDDESDGEDMPTTLPPAKKGRKARSETEKAAAEAAKKATAATSKAAKASSSLSKNASKATTTGRKIYAPAKSARSSTKQLPTPDGSSSPREAKTATAPVDQYRYDYKGEKITTNSEVVYACRMANLRQQVEARKLHKWADIQGINYNGNDMNLLYKNSEHFILINGDRLDRWYGFKQSSSSNDTRKHRTAPKTDRTTAGRATPAPSGESAALAPPRTKAVSPEVMVAALENWAYDSDKYSKRQKSAFLQIHMPGRQVDHLMDTSDLDDILKEWYERYWVTRGATYTPPAPLAKYDSYRPQPQQRWNRPTEQQRYALPQKPTQRAYDSYQPRNEQRRPDPRAYDSYKPAPRADTYRPAAAAEVPSVAVPAFGAALTGAAPPPKPANDRSAVAERAATEPLNPAARRQD